MKGICSMRESIGLSSVIRLGLAFGIGAGF